MIKSLVLFTASILRYIIRGIISLLAMLFGLLALVVVFIVSCPIVLYSKIKTKTKKYYEKIRLHFYCYISGYWIYF
jgi:hypothetical protein